ncbi:MAG: hypothetical protein ACKVQW_05030 [Pyrinomonadaceae bacterium]
MIESEKVRVKFERGRARLILGATRTENNKSKRNPTLSASSGISNRARAVTSVPRQMTIIFE